MEQGINKHKESIERIKPYQFRKGQSGNPNGRPMGASLKERAKKMLSAMTEEEAQKYLHGIDKRVIWEMAEGKPKADIELSGEVISKIVKLDVQ